MHREDYAEKSTQPAGPSSSRLEDEGRKPRAFGCSQSRYTPPAFPYPAPFIHENITSTMCTRTGVRKRILYRQH